MKKRSPWPAAAGLLLGASIVPQLSAKAREKNTARKLALWEASGPIHRLALYLSLIHI